MTKIKASLTINYLDDGSIQFYSENSGGLEILEKWASKNYTNHLSQSSQFENRHFCNISSDYRFCPSFRKKPKKVGLARADPVSKLETNFDTIFGI